MNELVLSLIFLPFIFSITLIFNSVRVRNIATYLYVSFLILISLNVFYIQDIVHISFAHTIHTIFIILDFILLGYFIYQGIKNSSKLVTILAVIQLLLFGLLLTFNPAQISQDIIVDKISSYMLLVINIVGGIIIIYSLKYIQSEDFKDCKKNAFISLLFFFIGVMNLIVTTNNLEIFFLAFEFTTLCSYLLIRYRGDKIANINALRALWMNQIGGVSILFSLILSAYVYDTIFFNILLEVADDTFLLPISLLVIASFVKGASIPFDKWLLGAMVAPTPVSAILHSATMVKIAPFLILKIAPAFSPILAMGVMLFGSFIFMSASLLALSKDFFKEILGLSTIALLGLMIAVASVGTEQSVNICLILIVFHAISKALLFLQAGILEKQYHLKYIKDIEHLASNSKLVVFFILIGFASLTLPPFGAFVGKFYTIELLASLINQNFLYLFSLVFILLGSVFLVLLYFKVATKLLTINKEKNTEQLNQVIPLTYKFTSFSLAGLLVFGIYETYVYQFLTLIQIAVPIIILLVTFILLYFSNYKMAHRVKEYNCGEKGGVSLSAFYFDIDDKYKKNIVNISIVLMIFILIVGV